MSIHPSRVKHAWKPLQLAPVTWKRAARTLKPPRAPRAAVRALRGRSQSPASPCRLAQLGLGRPRERLLPVTAFLPPSSLCLLHVWAPPNKDRRLGSAADGGGGSRRAAAGVIAVLGGSGGGCKRPS